MSHVRRTWHRKRFQANRRQAWHAHMTLHVVHEMFCDIDIDSSIEPAAMGVIKFYIVMQTKETRYHQQNVRP